MAQLSDDCFAFGGPMMSVDEAVAIIAARICAVDDVEIVPLESADGRILANDVSASLALPPFTNSAVDGYAVRSTDLPKRNEKAFPVSGRVKPCESSPARRCPKARARCSCKRTCISTRPAGWFFRQVCGRAPMYARSARTLRWGAPRSRGAKGCGRKMSRCWRPLA
jgi:hypothetical protein